MSSDLQKAFIEENLRLVRSIVVKNDLDRRAIQRGMEVKLGYNEESSFPGEEINYTNWKYYQNLNGQYHNVYLDGEPYSTDQVMEVISFDDRKKIIFNKAMLDNHPLTVLEYSVGNRYNKELVELYPSQENLIHRILNPIDIHKAYEASNGTILQYDQTVLAANEMDVINRLQDWIYGFFNRYQIKDMMITDAYYPHSFNVVFYSAMLNELTNIRHSNCKTNRVSPFHLWSYLGSHFGLDEYQEFLSLDQSLWLYRNIEYLIANAGKEETLYQLLDHLIEPRGLRAFSYKMAKADTKLVQDRESTVEFTRHPISSQGKEDQVLGQYKAEELIKKTLDRARNNKDLFKIDSERLKNTLKFDAVNEQNLKLIEVVEKANPIANMFDIKLIMLRYWAWLAHLGKYTGYVGIDFPGNFVKNITVMDNFVLFIYALNAYHGCNLDGDEEVIPDLLDMEIPVINVPDVINDKPVDIKALINKTCQDKFVNKKGIEEVIRTNALALPTVRNVGEFAVFAEKAKNRSIAFWFGLLDNAITDVGKTDIDNLYHDLDIEQTFRLKPKGTTFRDFFNDLELNVTILNKEEWHYVLNQSVIGGIGRGLDDGELADFQKAMIDLFDKLTSYDLNVVTGFTSSGVQTIRYEPIGFYTRGETYYSSSDDSDIGLHKTINSELIYPDIRTTLVMEEILNLQSDVFSAIDFDGVGHKNILAQFDPGIPFKNSTRSEIHFYNDIALPGYFVTTKHYDINGVLKQPA